MSLSDPKQESTASKRPYLARVWQAFANRANTAITLPFQPVALDTITTRFLMVFIFLLSVPLISVIVFTFFLLKAESTISAHERIRIIHDAFLSQLSQNEDYAKLLATQIHQSDCNNKLIAIEPKFQCLDVSPKPTIPEYRWLEGNLWFMTPTADKSRTLAYRIDQEFIQHFYRSIPSSMGDMAIIPSEQAINNNKNINAVAIYTDGLKKLHAFQWMNSYWIHQQMEDSASEINLGHFGNYWILQKSIFSANNLRLAHIVFWMPSLIESKFEEYYWGVYVISVISVVLAVILAMGAGRPITQPLLKLIRQMNTLHHGNLQSSKEQLVNVQGVHEINQLASAFNGLLQRLRLSYAMRDEFVATITHDLKVPMLAEKQTLNYLLKGTYGSITSDQQEVLNVLATTNDESLQLVNGLLEVYRYESGGVRLAMDDVDIQHLLRETINALKPLANEKRIQLVLETTLPSNEPVLVYSDPLELKRVLHNLVNNAITNTPNHGTITCKIETPKTLGRTLLHRISSFQRSTLRHPLILRNRILVSIQDSGIGFATEDLPKLFQQFSAVRGRNPMSTGLGLFNCHQVITAHNGFLWVETTEGEGSAVSFILPQTVEAYSDRRKQDRRQFISLSDEPMIQKDNS